MTIRAVARQAGIAAQSCYLHFGSRDELLWALYEQEFGRLHALLTEAALLGETPQQRLRACAQAYCTFAEDEPGAYGLLFQSRGVADHAWDDRLPGQPLADVWVRLVADCLGPAPDPTAVAVDLWAALHGTVTLRRHLPAFDWPGTRQESVDRLIATVVPSIG